MSLAHCRRLPGVGALGTGPEGKVKALVPFGQPSHMPERRGESTRLAYFSPAEGSDLGQAPRGGRHCQLVASSSVSSLDLTLCTANPVIPTPQPSRAISDT